MRAKQIGVVLGLIAMASSLIIGCSKKDDTATTEVEDTSTLAVQATNPHKGNPCKYTTAKFNAMRLNYRDYTNIAFSVDNSNGLVGGDPATSVLVEINLDTKNMLMYADTQIAVVGNDTIKQPRVFNNADTNVWLVYNEETSSYKEIADTSELLVPNVNVLDYNTVEDFIVQYFEGFPLPETMDGVIEGGIEYYTYSQPANDNDVIGIKYDTLGSKVYDLAIKPVEGDKDKYELVHFNVTVDYTVGTDKYNIYCNLLPTMYSKEELDFPTEYEELPVEPVEDIDGKPLYDNEGNPILDENGNQIVAPPLYNDDGTPMLDENGEQMYDMSVAYGIGADMPEDMQRAVEEWENENHEAEDTQETENTQETPETTEPIDTPEIPEATEGTQGAEQTVEGGQQPTEGQ